MPSIKDLPELIKKHRGHKNKSKIHTDDKLKQSPFFTAVEENGIKTPIERYCLSYTPYFFGSYRRDPENIYTKHFTDALVESGLLKDDSYQEIERFTINKPIYADKESQGFEVQIEIV